MDLVVRDADVDGVRLDVAVAGGRVAAIGPVGSLKARQSVDAAGGALLPGLNDHHVHLLAAAAAAESLNIGPGSVADIAALRERLQSFPPTSDGWIRCVDYHESVGGPLDRHRLDQLVSNRPVRVQHRSGMIWILNSAAIQVLGGAFDDPPSGVGRDENGELTGVFWRVDRWLAKHLPDRPLPDLAAVSRRLARMGVTGVTDTTPIDDPRTLDVLAASVSDDTIIQRVMASTGVGLIGRPVPAPLVTGPVKIVLDEADLPELSSMVEWIRASHASNRPVAVHSVDRSTLVFAVVAFEMAGSAPGDRIEHGAIIPRESIADLSRLDLTIVTQPSLTFERGDHYLVDVEPDDRRDLYRCRSLLDAGVRVAGSSDLPYTCGDPWEAMRAAHTRRTASGAAIGAEESLTARRSLDLYLGALKSPGGSTRQVAIGAVADLIVIEQPLEELLQLDHTPTVTAVLRDGRLIAR